MYSYSGTILNLNIIRIRIRPNICARILFVFAHSEKTNIIRIRIRSKLWFRILFVFVFCPKNSIRSPLVTGSGNFLNSGQYFLHLSFREGLKMDFFWHWRQQWLLMANAMKKFYIPLNPSLMLFRQLDDNQGKHSFLFKHTQSTCLALTGGPQWKKKLNTTSLLHATK